jgi:hypothetical protein
MAIHAEDGFCAAIRKAEVSTIVQDRFVATSFKLLPEEKKIEHNVFDPSNIAKHISITDEENCFVNG